MGSGAVFAHHVAEVGRSGLEKSHRDWYPLRVAGLGRWRMRKPRELTTVAVSRRAPATARPAQDDERDTESDASRQSYSEGPPYGLPVGDSDPKAIDAARAAAKSADVGASARAGESEPKTSQPNSHLGLRAW